MGWYIFNIVKFENLTYMKLYSLLIWTKNTKKSKNNLKAPKKSEIVQYTELYTTYSHVLDGEIKAMTANWCLIGVL